MDPSQYSGVPPPIYQTWPPEDGLAESRVPGPSPFGNNISPSHPTQPGYGHHYDSRPSTDPYSTPISNSIAGPPPAPLDYHGPEEIIVPSNTQSYTEYDIQRRPEVSLAAPIPYLSLPNYTLQRSSELRSTGTNVPGDLPDVILRDPALSASRYGVPNGMDAPSQNRFDSSYSTSADTTTKTSMPFKIRKRRYQEAQTTSLQPVRSEKTIRQERDRSFNAQYREYAARTSSGEISPAEGTAQITHYTAPNLQHSTLPITSFERVSSDTHPSTPSIQSSPASALSAHHQAAPWNTYSPQITPQTESSFESPSSRSLSPLPSTATSSRSDDQQRSTVFIHSNVPRTATASTVHTYEDYPEHRAFFPLNTEEHRKLRIAMHDVMHSEWKRRNELEPTSTDVLQFSRKNTGADGATSYNCLLYHDGEVCAKTWSRAERMLAHLRGAIDLRPFACEGEGDGDLCNCGMRFFAEDTLQQHRKNTRTVNCKYCSASVTPRNIRRHYRANCPNYPTQAP